MPGRVLIVDDDRSMCELLEASLTRHGLHVSWRTDAPAAFDLLRQEEFDVVLTDFNMPGMDGIELCDRIVTNRPDVPVVVVTAFGSLDTAVAAIRAGAYDFITKPIEMELLEVTIDRALQHRDLQVKVQRLGQALRQSRRSGELLGSSPPMEELFRQLERVADTETTVLITGESGSGKELVARSLHTSSQREGGPFVAINCASLPEQLLESELFGHRKGAFTGARSDRKGLFLQADGGTLFLDEIGELPLSLQPKLLRAIEERSVRPVGGDREVTFDVRLVAATNRDLEEAIEEGRFREDLFFRVNVVQLEVPPLRTRGTDILLLAQHFLEGFAARDGRRPEKISSGAAEKLLDYSWPGNVRELRNAMERAVALARYEEIVVDDLPEKLRAYRSTTPFVASGDGEELVPLEEIERRYILHVLESVGENKTLAARILGLDRKTLYRKLVRYDRPEDDRRGT